MLFSCPSQDLLASCPVPLPVVSVCPSCSVNLSCSIRHSALSCYVTSCRLCAHLLVSGRKKNPNPNFLVRIFSSGVGVFHVNGVGAKKFDTSLETREIKLFGWDIPGFCRDIPEVPEKFEKKKVCVQFPFPIVRQPVEPVVGDPVRQDNDKK